MGTNQLGVDARTHYGTPGGRTADWNASEQSADDTTTADTTGDPAGGPDWEAAWELASDLRAASHARALTTRALRDHCATTTGAIVDDTDIDDVVLMVDELITNAILHGTGPVQLRLRVTGPLLTGEIHDDNPAAPAPPGPGPGLLDWSEDGRGLMLVGALSTDFGTRPEPPGKTVWFTRLLGAHPNGHR